MRDELRAAVRGLLDHLPGQPYDKAAVREPIIALAKYVALARSPVDRDSQGEIRLVLDAGGADAHRQDAGAVLARVRAARAREARRLGTRAARRPRFHSEAPALDSRLSRRTHDGGVNARHCRARRASQPDHHAAALKTSRPIGSCGDWRAGKGKADCWELTTQATEWLKAMTLPVSSALPVAARLPVLPPLKAHTERRHYWQGRAAYADGDC